MTYQDQTHEKGATRKTAHPKSTRELAIELIDDNPQASRTKLLSLYNGAVREDEEYLDAVIEAQGTNDLNWAEDFIARRDEKPTKKRRKKKTREDASAAASEISNAILLNVICENGKRLRNQTGDDLRQLKANNTQRAGLYSALCKKVKGSETVGETLDEDGVRSILKKIGDPDDLATLFT